MNELGKNRIKLNICGCECILSSDDSESYIRSVGDEVQKSIDDIMAKNERISVTMAAVIAALSYCDDCRKASASAENLRKQIKDYLEDSSHARMEAEEAKRELERVKRENQTLRARLSASGGKGKGSSGEKLPPITPGAPEQQPQTGGFSHVEGGTPDDQKNFMSFFEKKTDEP